MTGKSRSETGNTLEIRVLRADEIDAVFGGVGSTPMSWISLKVPSWTDSTPNPVR